MSNNNTRKLYRDTENQKIFGVCSGLSDYFDQDVTLIRIIFVILFFAGLSGFLIYIIMAIVMEPKSVVMKKTKIVDDNDDPFAKYDK